MEYKPKPGTAAAQIYTYLTHQKQSARQLFDQCQDIARKSVDGALRTLINNNLCVRYDEDGISLYSLSNTSKTVKPEMSINEKMTAYLQTQVGMAVKRKDVIAACGQSTSYSSLWKYATEQNLVQEIPKTKPTEYLIMPAIREINKISYSRPRNKREKKKQELMEPEVKPNGKSIDIANMSLGEILQHYIEVKNENDRLKDALQRIAHELYNIAEIN